MNGLLLHVLQLLGYDCWGGMAHVVDPGALLRAQFARYCVRVCT